MSDALFDLDPVGTATTAQRIKDNTKDVPPETGVFQGFAPAVGSSGMKGLAGVARTVGILGAGLLQSSSAPSYAIGAKGRDTGTGASDMAFKFVDENLNNAVDYWTPSASQTGKAGQIVGGLVEGLVPLTLGPAGVPAMLGNAQVGTSTELVRQGVDADTALKVGLAASTANAIGFKVPILGNSLITRMATGAAGNLITNTATSVVQEQTLEGKGYLEAAKQYDPANVEARTLDVLMGMAFGVITHGGAKPNTAQADAVLTLRNAQKFQQESAPGTPATAESNAAHQANLEQAMQQLMRGEKVDLASSIREADFVKPPMKESAATMAVRDAIAEMRPKDTPALPTTGARGIRNNNPGNIVKSSTPWQGKIEGTDARFETFETPELGIRALAKNLITSQETHGNDTIDKLISRWAPESENNTSAYIDAVAKETGISADEIVNLRDPATLQKITNAIINHENGGHAYGDAVVRAGVDMAIGPDRSSVALSKDWGEDQRYSILNDQGESIGSISTSKKQIYDKTKSDPTLKDVLQLDNTGIDDPAMIGKGYAARAYEELASKTIDAGGEVWSGKSVSASAQRLYESLKRKGYDVQQNPKAEITTHEDGTVSTNGSYVYKIASRVSPIETAPKAENSQASALPPTPEINAMRQYVQENPHAAVLDSYDADGKPQYLAVHEVVAKIEAEHAEQVKETKSYEAAINCFLRRGA